MSNVALRFIHAGDFQLGRSLSGVAEAPEGLRPRLASAAYDAARGVFDLALSQQVDFVVLTGKLLDPQRSGARGLAFLTGQFERLAAKGIAVYWDDEIGATGDEIGATGDEIGAKGDGAEVANWPQGVELPANVHRFDPRDPATVHYRGDAAIARIGTPEQLAGATRNEQVSISTTTADAPRIMSIAVSHHDEAVGTVHPTADYYALGGSPERRVVRSSRPWAIVAGSPQGRSWDESGPHGCTFVEIDAAGQSRATLRPTDVVRWHLERVSIDDCPTRAAWESLLRTRVETISAEAGERVVLLRVLLAGGKTPCSRSTRDQLAAQMLAWLREHFANRFAPVWTAAIESSPAAIAAAAYEEDTLRGEFLRTVRQMAAAGGAPAWDSYLGTAQLPADVLARLTATDPRRAELLAEVAELGSELLGGDDRGGSLAPGEPVRSAV